jgi:cold shock CspA family protein
LPAEAGGCAQPRRVARAWQVRGVNATDELEARIGDLMRGETMKGKVKWFNITKRYGFIVRDDKGPDAFVHATDVEGGRTLREGETVEFELGQDDRGRPKAIQVKVVA